MILSFVPEPQTKAEVDMLRDALSEEPITSAYSRLVLWVSYAPELVFEEGPSGHLEEVTR